MKNEPETYRTAKEWASRSRLPYRTILAAAARGELEAIRPSGSPHGAIHISEQSWRRWLQSARLRPRLAGSARPTGKPSRPISEYAIH